MFVADLIIQLGEQLVLIAGGRDAVLIASARIVRHGNVLQVFDCDTIERAGRYLVVAVWDSRYRIFQLNCFAAIAAWTRDGGEIALQHGCGRNKSDGGGGVRGVYGALIAAKEEDLVLLDRSANHTAELVALQCIPTQGKRIARVEVAVAEKFK